MTRRFAGVALASMAVALLAAPISSRAAAACPTCAVAAFKWPPWLSIEWPISPYAPVNRDALLLVHTSLRGAIATVQDLSGSAEGIVNGERRTVPLHFDATGATGVFALRRQWPADGAWLLRITLRNETTAIVSLAGGKVTSVDVPMRNTAGGRIPRGVAERDIDSALAVLASRRP